MNRDFFRKAKQLTIAAIFMLSSPTLITAQQEMAELDIVVATCEQEPVTFPFQGGGCVPTEGAVVVVTSIDGIVIGTCISSPDSPESNVATCTVKVPYGVTVNVTIDEATIPQGYVPTNNPQIFEMPNDPVDGVFGGPVFLNLPQTPTSESTEPIISVERLEPEIVGDPEWWVVPNASGWGNTEDGKLYFGAYVRNPSTNVIEVGVSFRAYGSDGSPFPGCKMPMVDGPGVTTTIAPGETALLRCTRTIVPKTLDGIQVSAELWKLGTQDTIQHPITVFDAEIISVPDQSSPMETAYDVTALVSADSTDTIETALLFRFYDIDGVQVGTCETGTVFVEPGFDQRVTCWVPILLDTGGPQPVRVTAETVVTGTN